MLFLRLIMAVDGWVKIHRILSLDQIWTAEPFTRGQAWVDLILLANHVPGAIRARGVYINIDRGQVGWSEVKLAERWRWSRDKVRRWLSELEKKEHKIIQQKNNVTSLITRIKHIRLILSLFGTAIQRRLQKMRHGSHGRKETAKGRTLPFLFPQLKTRRKASNGQKTEASLSLTQRVG